jgi:hypothetical protein
VDRVLVAQLPCKGVRTIYSRGAIYFLGSAFWESASYFPLRFCAFILLGLSSTDQMRFEQSEIQARINTAI